MRRALYHILPLVATLACGVELPVAATGVDSSPPVPRLPPLASAGADREVLRALPASLDGAGSYHPQGRSFTAQWQQLAGDTVALSNEAELAPAFVAPLVPQTLAFRLTIDDGTWQTSDEVHILVRAEVGGHPAPVAIAGPDRYLDYREEAVPAGHDLVSVVTEPTLVSWQHVERQSASAALRTMSITDASEPVVYQLTLDDGALGSAPDYLVLYPYDVARVGARAPVAALAMPVSIAPGAAFDADATQGTDANGDTLHWRWEQVEGDTLLATPPVGDAIVSLTAPSRVGQLLTLKVYVRDGELESAPATASVVVQTPSALQDIALAPGGVLFVRPLRALWLYALGTATCSLAPVDVTFDWSQTYGPPVVPSLADDGLYASLIAPEQPTTLAYAVTAHSGAASTAPSVVVVSVVGEDVSSAPIVTLAAAPASPLPGETVTITVTAVDAEQDTLTLLWQTVPPGALVDPPTTMPDPPCNQTTSFTVVAPDAGQEITLDVTASDSFGAAGVAQLVVHVP